MTRVAVMGTGSWGTTFGMVLADAGAQVTMWGRRSVVCEEIEKEHRNSEYLGELTLPDAVRASTDPAAALDGADIVVLAVPSQKLRENLAHWRDLVPAEAVLVSLMKGVEHGSLLRMSEVIVAGLGAHQDRVAVVSGPNLAREIAARQPTATVVACPDQDVAEHVAEACSTGYFRPYTNHDVIGVELGGAVKNVIGLAVGIADGMGLGDNSKASIITRGLVETTRLGVALGAEPGTFAGLAGMGDLVATCASPLSRNRTFGEHLGQGMSVEEVVKITKQTAEGVKSCGPILELATAHGVEMPIVQQVTELIEGRVTLDQMIPRMFSRARKPELQ
ncbi:NAD(P)H-dependent glycerol-3-phosphate dehydrogenase [Spongisporangium articulatum]|uniref:Glycerol-3-phosphate dehydrogenase [NAD(P)+] n=1 Tax=Spongisporangium articulatum TaxID=3362603 RepID=A0ABW8AN25_9ACTN